MMPGEKIVSVLGLSLSLLNVPGAFSFVVRTPLNKWGAPISKTSMDSTVDPPDIFVPKEDDDVRFPSFQRAFNQRWTATNLDGVYMIRNAEDARIALDDAAERFPGGIKILSGGHCYENFVMNDGTTAILDVTPMQEWGEDPTLGYYLSTGDTNWGAFNKIFKAYGAVLPGGSCYSVGLGGHISGGGDGIMSRLYGLTVDWLTGVEIVVKDSDGPAQILTVTEDSEGDEFDLYWASCGGGGGNFGIITKYYFKELPPAPKGAIISNVAFNWDHLTPVVLKNILDWYVAFAGDDTNRSSSGKFPISHRAAGEAQMLLHTAYFNDEEKALAEAYHAEMLAELDALCPLSSPSTSIAFHGGYWSRPPKRERKNVKSRWEVEKCRDEVVRPKGKSGDSLGKTVYNSKPSDKKLLTALQADEDTISETTTDFPFYEATQTMNPSGPNQRGKYKSAYQVTEFPMSQVQAMYNYLTYTPVGLEEADMKQSLVQVDCFGGAINDVASDATPIAQREYVVKLQYQTYWVDEENDGLHLGWISDFYQAMYGPYGGTPNPDDPSGMFEGCYYNYPDVDLNELAGSRDGALYLYFIDNYENNPRNLVDVKRRWDPNNIFFHDQSIPVKPVQPE